LADGPLLAAQLSPSQLLLLSPCLDPEPQQHPDEAQTAAKSVTTKAAQGKAEAAAAAAAAVEAGGGAAADGPRMPSTAGVHHLPPALGFNASWDALVLDLTPDTLLEMLLSHAKTQVQQHQQQQQQQGSAPSVALGRMHLQDKQQSELLALLSQAAAAHMSWKLLQCYLIGRCIHLYCTVQLPREIPVQQQQQRQQQGRDTLHGRRSQQQQGGQAATYQQQQLCCKLVLQLDAQHLEVEWVQGVTPGEEVTTYALLQLPLQQQKLHRQGQAAGQTGGGAEEQHLLQKVLGSKARSWATASLSLGLEHVLAVGTASGKVLLLRQCGGHAANSLSLLPPAHTAESHGG
jgi:hypothetical protein